MKKFAEWWGDNWHIVTFGSLTLIAVINLYQSTVGHKIEVTQVSQENPGCIYLESSRLGAGQHYMICGGQITLVRTKNAADPVQVSQETVENAIAPEPETTATTAPAAK